MGAMMSAANDFVPRFFELAAAIGDLSLVLKISWAALLVWAVAQGWWFRRVRVEAPAPAAAPAPVSSKAPRRRRAPKKRAAVAAPELEIASPVMTLDSSDAIALPEGSLYR